MNIRGGNFRGEARGCRAALRLGRPPAENHHNLLGFRPVAEVKGDADRDRDREFRVFRGGGGFSYKYTECGCRAAFGYIGYPDMRGNDLGFRPVAEVKAGERKNRAIWGEERRVCHGGNWNWLARYCRSAGRTPGTPWYRDSSLGFRPVAEVKEGEGGGERRVFRGGYFGNAARRCRAECRCDGHPDERGVDLGFRPVAEVKSAPESARVLHGGSWIYDGRIARCALRYANDPGHRDVSCGFRPVAEGEFALEISRILRGGSWRVDAGEGFVRCASRFALVPNNRIKGCGFRPVAEVVEPAGRDTSPWAGFPLGRWMAVMHRLFLGETPDPADVQAIEEWRIRTIPVTIQVQFEVPEKELHYAADPSQAMLCSSNLSPCQDLFLVWDRRQNVLYPPQEAAKQAAWAYQEWFDIPRFGRDRAVPPNVAETWLSSLCERMCEKDRIALLADETGALFVMVDYREVIPLLDRFRAVENITTEKRYGR